MGNNERYTFNDPLGAIFERLTSKERRHPVINKVRETLRDNPELVTRRNIDEAIAQIRDAISRSRNVGDSYGSEFVSRRDVRGIFYEASSKSPRGAVLAPYES